MPPSVLAFLLNLVTHAPDLAVEGLKAYADVAHGEGGLQKVAKAIGDLHAIAQTAIAGAAAPVDPAAPVHTGNTQVQG